MTRIAISAEGLGKQYRIGGEAAAYSRLSETVVDLLRVRGRRPASERPSEMLWAIRDVSFEIEEGEVAGIVGRNGAGKTTLLKILSRITAPSEGHAELIGRVGSLLEVGTGFHQELTGRENVLLNGAILGMSRSDITRKFDEIVAFAEVERFIDTPVKRYSSGMQMRLAFAVAAHLEPEILIIDEVLAVGDLAFQRRCLDRIGQVSQEGRTVLFVSHNVAAVESLCRTAYLIEEGRVLSHGSASEVVSQYVELTAARRAIELTDRVDRKGDGRLRFTHVDADLTCGRPARITLGYRGSGPLRNVHVSVGLATTRGEGSLYVSNDLTGSELDLLQESGSLVCRFDRLGLLPGAYSASIYCTVNGVLADWITDAATLNVSPGDFFGSGKLPPPGYGSVAVEHRWETGEASA